MKKIFILLLIVLFVSSCTKNFDDYYNKEKIKENFKLQNYTINKNTLSFERGGKKFVFYILENEEESINLRKKIDDEMKIKHIQAATSGRNATIYSNYNEYCVAVIDLPKWCIPQGKAGIVKVECDIDSIKNLSLHLETYYKNLYNSI